MDATPAPPRLTARAVLRMIDQSERLPLSDLVRLRDELAALRDGRTREDPDPIHPQQRCNVPGP